MLFGSKAQEHKLFINFKLLFRIRSYSSVEEEVIKMKRSILIGTLVVTVLGATALSASHAFAQTPTKTSFESLIQKITDTFHLNKSDVQAVFDQHVKDHMAQRDDNFNARLDQAMKNGKITAAQKQLIVDKRKELQAKEQDFIKSLQGKTPAECKAAVQAQKQALIDWAKQNNIDEKYLFGMFIRGIGRGHWHFTK